MYLNVAYEYALKNGPSEETRKIVCEAPIYAYHYAINIDKGFHEDTWEAVENTMWGKYYKEFINSIMKEEIV
jgi:hypothetical protein